MSSIISVIYKMGKTLVLYVFHEVNERVTHFINKCIFEDDNIDFVVISNNKSNVFEVPSYVKKILRDNVGFDFGGWSEGLLAGDLYKNYDNFIFANSSIIGPFIQPNAIERNWTEFYLTGVRGDVKLFGSTINRDHFPHVQSYIFATDRECLEFLIEREIFTLRSFALTFTDAVMSKEVLMSACIIQNGWNIGCLMPYYSGFDFRVNHDYLPISDVMYSQYRNVLWNEFQLIFVKGNRIKMEL